MNLKLIFFTGTLLVSMSLLSSQVNATGLGIYGTTGKGNYVWTYHKSDIPDFDVDSKVSRLGIGFVLDTCLAMDKLFNYRLNIGYSKVTIDNEEHAVIKSDIKANEYHLYNTFGFGVFRSEIVRLWLGPQIGFGYINGEYDTTSPANEDNSFFTFFYAGALIAGLNFNIEDIITIGLDGGYRVSKHAGTADTPSTLHSVGITGTGKEWFANLSIMFRIGDTF
jgi:hypothetical protein